MNRRGRAVAAALLAATVTLGVVAPAAVATAPAAMAAAPAAVAARSVAAVRQAEARLPQPTGPYPVGTTALQLTDGHRDDPWQPGQARKLMISLWYPAARPAAGPGRAPYMVPAAAEHFGSADSLGRSTYHFEPDSTDWAGVRTRARTDAPVLPGGKRPVLLYSAGFGDPRSWGTGLVEDLASRGYVVVAVDHTYDASEVAFPDGSLATSVFPGMLGRPGLDLGALLRKVLQTRVDDIRFVLDRLAGLGRDERLPAGLAASLDLDRIGMVGHSGGGSTALQTMHDDPRLKAAVDLDGQLHFPGPDGTGVHLTTVARDGLTGPFLLMGTGEEDSGSYHRQPGWDALWQHSTGWHADVTLTGSRHGSYTDAQSLLPQLARQGAISAEQLTKQVGEVRPDRAVLATRSYVASFFDRWLRGRNDQLLDGPSPRFPEMVYER
ncbi:esterase [Kitasatospora sp. MMS16-BH015]|uniref:alpha/beta hydrolase family protein n=1 Tax=Kitasatospora sp. MMS16-BH015 TaxID=2018025 RepID=UPI000CA09AC9|nr:esterase [Kitasatospora sp. MMS16-BH015]AUG80114.1 esterase [Kitasatospora sp. MMS16-BH015]